MNKFLGISESEYQKRQKSVEKYESEQKDFLKILETKYRLKWSGKKK